MNEIAKMEEEKGHLRLSHTDRLGKRFPMRKVTALIEVRVTPMRGQGFDSIAERIYNYRR